MNLRIHQFKLALLFATIFAQAGFAVGQHSDQGQPDDRLAQVDKGTIAGNIYTNRALGFSTDFPAGWQIIEAAKQRALIEANHQDSFGDSPGAQREHEMVWRCSHLLLWTSENPENHLMTVAVWDPSCFPEVKFPASLEDHDGIQHTIEGMRRPPFGQGDHIIGPDEKITTLVVQGHLLLDVTDSMASDESKVYISSVMTPVKNYWVAWMFIAPSEAALQELKKKVFSSVKFDVP
jgi:hypothetical protein